ncbi:hypothetical protein Anas_08038, partial [Armadillidium nasatum]
MSYFLVKIDRNILDRLEENIDQNINTELMSPSKYGGKEFIRIQRIMPKGSVLDPDISLSITGLNPWLTYHLVLEFLESKKKYRRIHDCGLEEVGAADEGWIKNFTLHMLKVSPKLKRIYLLPSIFCVYEKFRDSHICESKKV